MAVLVMLVMIMVIAVMEWWVLVVAVTAFQEARERQSTDRRASLAPPRVESSARGCREDHWLRVKRRGFIPRGGRAHATQILEHVVAPIGCPR